jgi:hypothetical protein
MIHLETFSADNIGRIARTWHRGIIDGACRLVLDLEKFNMNWTGENPANRRLLPKETKPIRGVSFGIFEGTTKGTPIGFL